MTVENSTVTDSLVQRLRGQYSIYVCSKGPGHSGGCSHDSKVWRRASLSGTLADSELEIESLLFRLWNSA
eukprot:2057947-Rhodomonas_salina.1